MKFNYLKVSLLLMAISASIMHSVVRAESGDNQFSYQEIRTMPSLGEVPAYTGQARLIKAMSFPNARGVNAYTVVFGCAESMSQVLDWYRDALGSNKWKIDRSSNDPHLVSASKQGNFIKIIVGPPIGKGDGARVLMEYRSLKQFDITEEEEAKTQAIVRNYGGGK